MPTIERNGTRLYYEDSGAGDETILFSHGLLWDTRVFGPQIAALRSRYRCVAYDHRGQGRSAVPRESTIPMDLLALDAAALIYECDLGPVHFVGLSMGGFVGMRLAAWHPELIRTLTLVNTSAEPETRKNVPRYKLLAAIVAVAGPKPVASQVMSIMFGSSFLEDPARADERRQWQAILAGNRRSITKAVNGVIQRDGVVEQLARIVAPTLVIVGDEDVATTPDRARRLAAAIPSARLVQIPRAGHTSPIEAPEAVTAAIEELLTGR